MKKALRTLVEYFWFPVVCLVGGGAFVLALAVEKQ